MRAAIVTQEGLVENVILLDPDNSWEPPAGKNVIALADDSRVGPGYRRVGDTWATPVIPGVVDEPIPTLEERLAFIEEEVQGMRSRAAATSVSNADAIKVRDAIAGPKST